MPAGDVYRLVTFATSQNSTLMNTLAVQTLPATDPDATARQTLADDFKTIWQPTQHGNVTWTTWELRQLWGAGMTTVQAECRREGGAVFGGTLTAPVTGGNSTTDPLPPQNAMVVTLITGQIGRRRRGRIYGFGLTEGSQSGGLWVGANITTITAALTVFFNKYKSGGTSPNYQLVIWSERTATGCILNASGKGMQNIEQPRPDQAMTPVTGFTVRNIVYNQRRRTLGVGR